MNNVFLSGRFTREHDIKYSQSAEPFAILSNRLAVPRRKKGETDFLSIKAFGKTAENINKYFKKGNLIFVECHVQTGSYENKDGKKIYTTDFVVDNFHFSGEKRENENRDNKFYDIDKEFAEADLPFSS